MLKILLWYCKRQSDTPSNELLKLKGLWDSTVNKCASSLKQNKEGQLSSEVGQNCDYFVFKLHLSLNFYSYDYMYFCIQILDYLDSFCDSWSPDNWAYCSDISWLVSTVSSRPQSSCPTKIITVNTVNSGTVLNEDIILEKYIIVIIISN